MGKEVKIGVAVLLVLLISLGVVVARRFVGNRQEAEASAVEARSEAREKVVDDALRKDFQPGAQNHKAAVVAPKSPSAQSPKSPPGDLAQLIMVAEGEHPKHHGGGPKASPPSFMPNPPEAKAADPADRYGSAYVPPPAPQAYPDDRAALAETGEARGSHDPLRHRKDHDLPGNAEEGRSAQQKSQAPDPFGQISQMPESSGRGYGDSAGRWTEDRGARYIPPAPPEQSEPPRASIAREYRNAADSRYEGGGAGLPYSNPRSEFRHGGGRNDFRPAAPSAASLSGKALRREDGTYEIQPNDNYWIISEKLYGTGAYFRALAEHNRKKTPQEDQLPVGDTIAAPDVAQLEKAYPDLCPKPSHRDAEKRRTTAVSTSGQYAGSRTYVVQEGDTLFDIARNELGKASRWSEIYELNREQLGPDYNYLPRGLQLTLPGNEAGDAVTRRPTTGSLYHR